MEPIEEPIAADSIAVPPDRSGPLKPSNSPLRNPVRNWSRTALHHRRTDPDRLLLLRRRVLTHPRRLPILLRTGKVSRRKLLLLLRSGLLDGLRGPLRPGRAAIESAAIGSSIGST